MKRREAAAPTSATRLGSGLSAARLEREQPAPGTASLLQLQRVLGNRRVAAELDAGGLISAARSFVGRTVFSGTHPSEREADAVAKALHASGPAVEPLRDGALPAATRAWADRAFGFDFSGVRVHANVEAASLSRAMNARAFTVGANIYLDRAELTSGEGPRLLAHELAHVVQQTSSARHTVGAVQLHPVGATAIQRDERPATTLDTSGITKRRPKYLRDLAPIFHDNIPS